MNIKFPLTVIAVVLLFSLNVFLPDAADARGRGPEHQTRRREGADVEVGVLDGDDVPGEVREIDARDGAKEPDPGDR